MLRLAPILLLPLALGSCGMPLAAAVPLAASAAAGTYAVYNLGAGLRNACLSDNPPPVCIDHPKPKPPAPTQFTVSGPAVITITVTPAN